MSYDHERLDPAGFLDPALPAAKLRRDFAAHDEPVRAVGGGAAPRALLERDVRVWLQDFHGDERAVGDLAHAELCFPDRAAAERHLDSAEGRHAPGALVAGVDGEVTRCVRRVPPIRLAVVMAGGFGQRLRPLTDETPKPLLPVGGEPLLFRTLRDLRRHGVRRALISVNYLAEQVEAAVGNGAAFDLEVGYLREERPLDTGAGLAQIGRVDEPFLVVNGDVLTDVNLAALGREHVVTGAAATVGTFLFPAPLPYGLVHVDGRRIRRIEEKPVLRYPINAGLYAFDPGVLERVTPGEPLAMVEFLNGLAADGEAVHRFPIVEYWNDVGSPVDYERAQAEVAAL